MTYSDNEAQFKCSASVQRMRDELGDELVTAIDMTGYLLGMHPEYAQGLAANMVLAREAGAANRPVDEWLSAVSALYENGKRPLDGRLVLLGLALLVPHLAQALRRSDFLLILMAEYEPAYDSLLAPAARDLFYSVFGRPRMEASGDQVKGIDRPDAAAEATGMEETGSKDPFESLKPVPPMPPMPPVDRSEEKTVVEPPAVEDVFESLGPEVEEAYEAVLPAAEELFEAMIPGEEEIAEAMDGETPENGGEKGIEPESHPQTPGTPETPLKQARRLEAAMPESVRVNQATELLVMLPRAISEGLRAELPKETEGGEIIDKDDVKERDAQLVFPAADKPIIVYFAVAAAKTDFEIEDPVKKVKIYADSDGDYQIFNLVPRRVTERAPVQVFIYRDEELTDQVSSVRLFTKIDPPSIGDEGDGRFADLRRLLAYASAPVHLTIAGDVISVGSMNNVTGVAVGRGAAADVSSVSGGYAFAITQLFTPLLSVVSSSVPRDQLDLVIGHVQALQMEIEKGPGANDPQMATLLQLISEAAPASCTVILDLFKHPQVNTAAGDVTRFVLGQIAPA